MYFRYHSILGRLSAGNAAPIYLSSQKKQGLTEKVTTARCISHFSLSSISCYYTYACTIASYLGKCFLTKTAAPGNPSP